MSEMVRRKRRSFTKEQKESAVAAYHACKNYNQVARDLDLHASVLQAWVKQDKVDKGGGTEGEPTTDERSEIGRLRRELRRVEQERDFLKKAAAFFARDEDPHTR